MQTGEGYLCSFLKSVAHESLSDVRARIELEALPFRYHRGCETNLGEDDDLVTFARLVRHMQGSLLDPE